MHGAGLGQQDEESWRPLLRPAFLQGLWLQLGRLWQREGVAPGGASCPAGAAHLLRDYLRNGRFPDASPAWSQVLLAPCSSAWRAPVLVVLHSSIRLEGACQGCMNIQPCGVLLERTMKYFQFSTALCTTPQELLGSYMALSEVPEPGTAATACEEAVAHAAAAAPAGPATRGRVNQAHAPDQAQPAALLLALRARLPECPPDTLQQLAICLWMYRLRWKQ